MSHRVAELETALNDFDPGVREGALRELVALADAGAVKLPPPVEAVNMHCHTFFSFNGYGYSPSALAWLGRRHGFAAMGIVDFDVLDGVDEFLDACELAGLRGSAGIETRVFVPEFAAREINSPGEPGVCYQMGIGFASGQSEGRASEILAGLRQRAADRNRGMMARTNAHLAPVSIDYERDVLPLTPKGNATERHMLTAYVAAAKRAYPERAERVRFWAEKLAMEPAKVDTQIDDGPEFKNVIRAKLMKRGGVGYVEASPESFPTVDAFHEMIALCGALPCFAWLDGASAGERDIEELLGLMVEKGAVAVNIIPDRNWNIKDPENRRVKVQSLHDFVRLAQERDLPLNVGTEMNKYGLKLVDDFDAPELEPVRRAFLDGAHFVYGHTLMQRALGMGYQSDWAETHLPSRRERNDFYTQVGYRVEPGIQGKQRIERLNKTLSAAEILTALEQ
ncbi:MAG: hypothetical protein JW918_00795 [Anaerolineae bacterium]|nr:hypothetical protein [Anaerolineae bacterium]